MQKQVNEILYLAEMHGFDVEGVYPDGETVTEKAVTLEELSKILSEVFLIPNDDKVNKNSSAQLPADAARRALNSLEALMDKVESKRSSHFTPDEWVILTKAEGILTEYLYDITH